MIVVLVLGVWAVLSLLTGAAWAVVAGRLKRRGRE